LSYLVLKEAVIAIGDYRIVPLRKEDILSIKDWRNDQMAVLRQNTVLTSDAQLRYYDTVVRRSFEERQPNVMLFSYLLRNECIGYGGLTNIDWFSRRTEMSFLLDTGRANRLELYEMEFSNFISLIKKVIFLDLEFNRIFTETFDIRDGHVRILEKNGFRLEGRLRQHVLIDQRFVDSLIHGYIKEDFRHGMER